MSKDTYTVTILDVSALDYPDRLIATSLQGLANRQGPKLFLNFGVYDTTRSGF